MDRRQLILLSQTSSGPYDSGIDTYEFVLVLPLSTMLVLISKLHDVFDMVIISSLLWFSVCGNT